MKQFLKLLFSCFVLLQILQSAQATPLQRCIPACPRIFDPICAVNGLSNYKYFHNECLMRYDSCHTQQVWKQTNFKHCLPLVAARELKQNKSCLRICQLIYAPVCGKDLSGAVQTFGNECSFQVENCLANGKWKLTRNSDCGITAL